MNDDRLNEMRWNAENASLLDPEVLAADVLELIDEVRALRARLNMREPR